MAAGVRDGERCGCGQPFLAVPVLAGRSARPRSAAGTQVDVDRITRLRAQVDRGRFLPQLASPPLRGRLQPALDEYVAYYRRTYAAIGQVSGNPVVIDSSKHASLAFCLRSSPGLDLRVVHMVRDRRAVAYSWSKIVDRPEARPGARCPPTRRPARRCAGTCRTAPCSCCPSSAPPRCGCGTRTSSGRPGGHAQRDRRLRRPARRAGLRLPGHRRARPVVGRAGGDAHRVRATRCASPPAGSRSATTTPGRRAMLAGNRRTVTTLTLPLLMRYGYLRRRAHDGPG